MTLHGFSTALFSTWYFLREHGILFDCGDGACAGLLQSARKVKHVFISHADRDHLAGLLQFNQLNGREELKVYYPKDCGSFPAIADFTSKFDPHTVGTKWIPIDNGTEISIRADLSVCAFANRHVESKKGTKSLSFAVNRISRKLRPQFIGLPSHEIANKRKELGADAITERSSQTELIYSGDTPIETDGRYNDTNVLIHEATFLRESEIDPDNPKRNKHSSLDQVMAMVAQSNIKTLVLGHFSSRYEFEEIDEAIRRQIELHSIQMPVYRLLPGQTGRDILGNKKYQPT